MSSHGVCSSSEITKSFSEKWIKSVTNQICFIWEVILNLEIQILIFVQSHQKGNFQLYHQFLLKDIWWYFSLGHFHYGQWLSVHSFDFMIFKHATRYFDSSQNVSFIVSINGARRSGRCCKPAPAGVGIESQKIVNVRPFENLKQTLKGVKMLA